MRFRSCRQPLARSVGTLMAAVGSLRHSQAGRQPTDAWSHERPFAIAHSATRCLRRGMSARCGVLAAKLGRPTSLILKRLAIVLEAVPQARALRTGLP